MALISPKMFLKIWNLLADSYDHDQLAENFLKIDSHNHSDGQGVQIPTGGIEDGAVTLAKIQPGTITASAFSDGTIGGAKLTDGAVTTPKLADVAVTTAKLADASVTGAKVSGTLKPSSGAAAGTEALRALGTTATTAAAGNDTRLLIPSPAGLTGATAPTRWVGGTFAGKPTTGTFLTGDVIVDQTGKLWICTAGGSPGTWVETSGANNYGLGTDGAATISTNVTLLRDMHYSTLVVASGGIINTNGHRIFCTSPATVQSSGIVRNNGTAGADNDGGAGSRTAGGLGAAGGPYLGGGTNGGDGAGGSSDSLYFGSLGGVGGVGGNDTGFASGIPGTRHLTTVPWTAASLNQVGVLVATQIPLSGGTGGAGGSGGNPGAGGGGGGVVVLSAPNVTVNSGGIIQANGGRGGGRFGTAGSSGGGGGGGGGAVLIFTGAYTNNGTVEAAGGAAGGGSANGVVGGAGTVAQVTL